MIGRVYDPVIGRFCSADPFVQAPGNSQSYNRYSYCFNNPLSLTDPTGFITWGSVWHGVTHAASSIGHAVGSAAKSVGKWVAQNWRTVVVVAATIVVSVVTAGVLSGPMALVASTALGGAVNGGLTTAIYGGSISQIFISALKGAGAAVGGAAYNMIQGDWRGAAISAGASLIGMAGIGGTGSLAVAGRAVMAAAVGGTVAKLNGGSFANGAITAAFASVMGDAIRMATSPRAENSNSAAEEEEAPTDYAPSSDPDSAKKTPLTVYGGADDPAAQQLRDQLAAVPQSIRARMYEAYSWTCYHGLEIGNSVFRAAHWFWADDYYTLPNPAVGSRGEVQIRTNLGNSDRRYDGYASFDLHFTWHTHSGNGVLSVGDAVAEQSRGVANYMMNWSGVWAVSGGKGYYLGTVDNLILKK